MRTRIGIAILTIALAVTGCGRTGTGHEDGTARPAASGTFGDLTEVCRPGNAKSAPAQGVTATEIEVGMFSDIGFTKNPDLVDAAKVFTSWCDAAGGINGRKIVVNLRDTNLTQVRQRMLDACREDFVLAGGSAALDALGVKDRLSCLLPEFPAQVHQTAATGADLQLGAGSTPSEDVNPYTGYYGWLTEEAYPDSRGAVGMINGDSPITKALGAMLTESFTATGAKVVYSDLYPIAGVPDWTPYAQAIKAQNVKGLIFFGDFRYLVKLEEALTAIGYRLDWIDANANSYGDAFLDVAKPVLATQNNVADLSGTAPMDAAGRVPAIDQLRAMFQQYAPGAAITFQTLRAIQSWVLFAKSATSCGDNLTRACVFEAARAQTAWTAGGLQAPVDLSGPRSDKPRCFNVQQATPQGWKAANFGPNSGEFRCGSVPYKYKQDYGRPMTLADVGKSMNDLK